MNFEKKGLMSLQVIEVWDDICNTALNLKEKLDKISVSWSIEILIPINPQAGWLELIFRTNEDRDIAFKDLNPNLQILTKNVLFFITSILHLSNKYLWTFWQKLR